MFFAFRFWLLRFLAFLLLGFLASWLFGFLAFWLLGFWAFRLFVGLCSFWWLFGFGFSHPLHSQFLFGRWRFGFCVYAAFGGFGFSHPLLSQFLSGLFWLLHPFIGFWIWLPASSASPVPPYESSLLRTSWGGAPPQPTRYCLDMFRLFAE